MARKKEQHTNSIDNRSANAREKHQGVGPASCAAGGGRKASEVRDFKDVDDVSCHLNEDVKNAISSAEGKKRNKKSAHSQRRVDVKQGLCESIQTNRNSFKSFLNFARENVASDNHAHESEKSNSNFRSTANGFGPDGIARNLQLYNIIGFMSLRSTLWIWKKLYEWVERQKPSWVRAADYTRSACDYFRLKYLQTYPVVLKWIGHFGNISLLVLMIWLNCFVRGMDSLLRMGTTSFFAVVWFGVLSVIAMAGIIKFLMVLVVTAVIGLFVGLIIALFIVIVAAGVFLWLYGSFWMTSMVAVFGGFSFALGHDRLALWVTTSYSMYCAWTYVGWLGLILGLNLSFFSSDVLIYFLKCNMDEHRNMASEQATRMQGQEGLFKSPGYSEANAEQPAGRSAEGASTSGVDSEISSEDEVIRLLNCTDHYSAMGLLRYQEVDVSVLKREYRKKAMLVHPDKNMGNEKAAEAFKKLQNAYEVLLDSLKRKTYDDALRREELLNYFCQFPSVGQKKRRHGFFTNEFARSEAEGQDPLGEIRRIACKKCGGFHMWVPTKKSKSTGRWCQDCKDCHQAKDGDGWVEQSSQPFLFGMLQKVDAPVAYVCADSKVYNATEWYMCQGMRCPVNSHKPSFHVNTSVTRNHNQGKGNRPSHKEGIPPEENMTEDEFFEWLQNAVNSGMFDNFAGGTPGYTAPASSRQHGPTNSGGTSTSAKKKKKGKKQW